MKAKKIKVVKDWPELKSVCNIQVFLSFANFYWQFIQGFSKIAALLISILYMTGSPNKLAPSKNNNSRSGCSKNNNSRPTSGRNNSDSEVNGFGVSGNGVEYAKKSGKLKSKKIV